MEFYCGLVGRDSLFKEISGEQVSVSIWGSYDIIHMTLEEAQILFTDSQKDDSKRM